MGEIDESRASNSLSGLAHVFRMYLSNIRKLEFCEIRVIILALAQYLYCKYYDFGKQVPNKVDVYDMNADVMYRVYKGNLKLATIASYIIIARNHIGHDINAERANNLIKQVQADQSLIRFLIYEGLLDEGHKYIEPVGGEYVLSEIRKDIIGKKNKSLEEQVGDPAKSMMGFGNASSIMSGDK